MSPHVKELPNVDSAYFKCMAIQVEEIIITLQKMRKSFFFIFFAKYLDKIIFHLINIKKLDTKAAGGEECCYGTEECERIDYP